MTCSSCTYWWPHNSVGSFNGVFSISFSHWISEYLSASFVWCHHRLQAGMTSSTLLMDIPTAVSAFEYGTKFILCTGYLSSHRTQPMFSWFTRTYAPPVFLCDCFGNESTHLSAPFFLSECLWTIFGIITTRLAVCLFKLDHIHSNLVHLLPKSALDYFRIIPKFATSFFEIRWV